MADSNQKDIRKKIQEIHANTSLSPGEKARLQQQLLRTSLSSSQDTDPSCSLDCSLQDSLLQLNDDKCVISKEEAMAEASPSYWVDGKSFGCAHYPRGAQIFAPCCGKIFPCRVCHDKAMNHQIDRYAISDMWCMYCKTPQPFAQFCVVKDCPSSQNENPRRMAWYFCDICKFLDDTPDKKIYHCPDCRLCRVGEGLGTTLFHCHTCCLDLLVSEKDKHVCIPDNSKSECPVCGEVIFQSRKGITLMLCGHSIHVKCYKAMLAQYIFACPICRKTIIDPEFIKEEWENLRENINAQPMPEEFQDARVDIFCNDCHEITNTAFHFLGCQCSKCNSFNTNIEKSYGFPT